MPYSEKKYVIKQIDRRPMRTYLGFYTPSKECCTTEPSQKRLKVFVHVLPNIMYGIIKEVSRRITSEFWYNRSDS